MYCGQLQRIWCVVSMDLHRGNWVGYKVVCNRHWALRCLHWGHDHAARCWRLKCNNTFNNVKCWEILSTICMVNISQLTRIVFRTTFCELFCGELLLLGALADFSSLFFKISDFDSSKFWSELLCCFSISRPRKRYRIHYRYSIILYNSLYVACNACKNKNCEMKIILLNIKNYLIVLSFPFYCLNHVNNK